jgi:S1-C subfamily serine protease
MLNLSTAFRDLKLPASTGESELLLVRQDGMQFGARFLGLDASTGLSLLETDQHLLPSAPETESVAPVVGQRVRVIAPVRAAVPPVVTPDITAATTRASKAAAPVGDEGVLYMNMSEEAGQLRAVKRSPSGMMMEMTAELNRISSEWAGGIALSETGNLIGIIEQSDARDTRLLSAEIMHGAARRVKARRASVPLPWLGARGDALAFAQLDQLLASGWSSEQARLLLSQKQRRGGVLLTSVAPGTPAAHAGLRPGDVVSRIGQHDVRSVEDMSLLINEHGGNTVASFTVLRAQSAPLNLAVHLRESSSPGLDTARAELRAAYAELRAKKGAQKISAESELIRARVAEAETRYRAASEAYRGLAVKPLLSFGLEAVRIAPGGPQLSGLRPKSGLLVTSVQPSSAAIQSKIRVGDIIESINGQFFSEANWNINFSTDYDTELTLGVLRDGEKLSFNLSRRNSPQ